MRNATDITKNFYMIGLMEILEALYLYLEIDTEI